MRIFAKKSTPFMEVNDTGQNHYEKFYTTKYIPTAFMGRHVRPHSSYCLGVGLSAHKVRFSGIRHNCRHDWEQNAFCGDTVYNIGTHCPSHCKSYSTKFQHSQRRLMGISTHLCPVQHHHSLCLFLYRPVP